MERTMPGETGLPQLQAIDTNADASVALASLPLPRGADWRVGFAGLASQAVPLAWYPADSSEQASDVARGQPRQVMLLGLGDAAADPTIRLSTDAAAVTQPASDWPGPTLDLAVVSKKKTGMLMREVNELVVGHGERTVGLRMGLRRSTGLNWWQWVRIEPLWSGPICQAFRIAGYAALDEAPEDFYLDGGRYNAGVWLHRHNWIFAEIYALVFANGLLRLTARHINNRFFDKGEELTDAVPVLGLRASGAGASADAMSESLTGARCDFELGGVHLDLSRCTDLHSPEHPGRIERDGDLVVVQPYEGCEMLFGEGEPRKLFELSANEHRIWPGLARSFGLDISLADQPIRTQRYLPPLGWITHCGVLWPDGHLAARGPLEPAIEAWRQRVSKPRPGVRPFHGTFSGRFLQTSAFWDGEYAHGLMIHAYRTVCPDFYRGALHHAYAMADIGIDHIDFTARIWYMKRHSTGQVLQRTLGILAAYLEEGDPYLLRVAESVADAAYAMDRSNWPRRSYGRDGAYIRSLTRLYDVTGERHYLRRAGDACRRAAQCQRPDGAFTDQGGTAEAHGHLNEIVKPWMNSILTEAMVDYLERAGEDAAVERAVIRCADWLLSVLQEDQDGRYWPYEVAFGENDGPPYAHMHPQRPQTRHPAGEVQLDYNARTLLWVSRRTGDAKYARAWQDTYQRHYVRKGQVESAYGTVKAPENFSWHEAHLWGARWTPQGIELDPMLDLLEPGRSALIELPDGSAVRVCRTDSGVHVDAPEPAMTSNAAAPVAAV